MNPHLLAALLLATAPLAHSQIPDLPPDATSGQYQQALSTHSLRFVEEDGLDPILRAGERNLQWLEHINSFRPAGDKLSFTSKETQRSYPIDQPNEYNPAIIQKKFADLKSTYPRELARVVFENEAFTPVPPVETKIYLEMSRELDRRYQSAARWRTMAPNLPELESQRGLDIRGYYYFLRRPERETILRGFYELKPEEQTPVREALLGMCLNRYETLAHCRQEIEKKIAGKTDLWVYYQSQEIRSASIYKSFFRIPPYAPRKDFYWENGTLTAPFTDPMAEDVRHFLQFNMEDEWRGADWQLKLPFTTEPNHPYVVFRPGATPRVNGLGGDRITMNANQPLTEYDAQWTIRHEFGHVLGLPDCYVEFYVREREVIMNYQIDVENIMCSRRGHVKPENMDELKRVYEKK